MGFVVDVIGMVLFVLSTGLFFNRRFRRSATMIFLAGSLAVVSTLFLFRDQIIPFVRVVWTSSIEAVTNASTADRGNASAPITPQYEAGDMFRDCETCPQMVVLEGGAFTMGSPEDQSDGYNGERPAHEVRVRAFAIGRFEVTRSQWEECALDGSCANRGNGRANSMPAVDMSWPEAQQYLHWLNRHLSTHAYRLPTEAEWEYAARAGTTTQFYWGSSADEGCRYANMWDRVALDAEERALFAQCEDGFMQLAAVGQLQPNEFGLYDMIGNAWEWVEDCYVAGYRDAPIDGSPRRVRNCASHVARGGSALTYSRSQRVSFRGRTNGDYTLGTYLGLRVARDLT